MIHRTGHNDNYLIVSNDIIRRRDLSDGAKVLLLYLLSCSDDWDFSVKGISACLGISTGAVSSRLQELQKAGYVEVKRFKTDKGILSSCKWEVFESPRSKNLNVDETTENSPRSNSPNVDLPNVDLPNVENLNAKEIPNIRITKYKNNQRKNILFRKPTFEEVDAYCQERQNGIDAEQFIDYYESKGWMIGKNKMKDWKASVRTWERNRKNKPKAIKPNPVPEVNPFTQMLKEEGYSI